MPQQRNPLCSICRLLRLPLTPLRPARQRRVALTCQSHASTMRGDAQYANTVPIYVQREQCVRERTAAKEGWAEEIKRKHELRRENRKRRAESVKSLVYFSLWSQLPRAGARTPRRYYPHRRNSRCTPDRSARTLPPCYYYCGRGRKATAAAGCMIYKVWALRALASSKAVPRQW